MQNWLFIFEWLIKSLKMVCHIALNSKFFLTSLKMTRINYHEMAIISINSAQNKCVHFVIVFQKYEKS